MKSWLVLGMLLATSLFGKELDKRQARRLEVMTDRVFQEPLNKPLRPERVYSVWAKPLKHWIYVLTNDSGKVRTPVQALAPGTVMPSFKVGGEEGKRYLLTKQGTWILSKAPLQRRIWEFGPVTQYRVFLSAKGARPPAPTRKN